MDGLRCYAARLFQPRSNARSQVHPLVEDRHDQGWPFLLRQAEDEMMLTASNPQGGVSLACLPEGGQSARKPFDPAPKHRGVATGLSSTPLITSVTDYGLEIGISRPRENVAATQL